ncbi:MAG TPA: gluconate 2-dehydrogenase subunit 3 family protein [Xanthobacteraceae bacterium]
MDPIERRVFIEGAMIGTLSFVIDGVETLLTPRQAHAQGVPLRTLNPEETKTLEAVGEALVPGARAAGVVQFVDQQVSIPPEEALLEARIMNVRPPFANFYRAALGAIDRASRAHNGGRGFAELDAVEQHQLIDNMRQNKIEGWQGPGAPFVYFLLRTDAVDVVYGTMEGYARLGVPYMPHIAPTRRW